MRNTLERALRLNRYVVSSVANGDEAKRSLTDDLADILLSDVSVGGSVNGFELAHWARELWPALPIVLISGLALYDPPVNLMTDPSVRMLAKPFNTAALMAVLAELLTLQSSGPSV